MEEEKEKIEKDREKRVKGEGRREGEVVGGQ